MISCICTLLIYLVLYKVCKIALTKYITLISNVLVINTAV